MRKNNSTKKRALSTSDKRKATSVSPARKDTNPIKRKQKPSIRNTKNTEVLNMAIPKKNKEVPVKNSRVKKTVLKPKAKKISQRKTNKTAELEPISEIKSLQKERQPLGRPQSIQDEQLVEESKFYTGYAQAHVPERRFHELPGGYGDNRIIIQVRDPYWIHAYWELTYDNLNALRRQFGSSIDNAKRRLRVYDITDVIFDGSNANKFFDIEINNFANNWYINVGEPGRSYCVDIGIMLYDGRFIMLARSNYVTTPIDGPSNIFDEEWMSVEDDFNRLYGLSAGLGIGLSSLDVRKQIMQRMSGVSSGILSSPPAEKKAARKFWLVVNTELVVYGATEPGAQLTIQGKPMPLKRDGTFSVRFALPDGKQVIPVKAVSPDGIEERVITPVVQKETT